MELSTIFVISVMFNILNIVMHGVGTWLLLCTYIRRQKSTQTLYLINLALAELIRNMLLLIWNSVVVVSSTYKVCLATECWYVYVFLVSGVFYNYMVSMYYITGDRLLHIILNVKYPVYWSVGKTKRLSICTWVFCLTINTSLTLVYHFIYKSTMYKDILVVYIPCALFIVYVLFAILTYTVMFLKFARSRRNTAPHSSLFNIFINSRFFVSLLLISSFLLLTVIPTLIRSFMFLTGNRISKQIYLYVNVSARLSDFIDAIIYIFLQPDIRKLLLIKLSCGLLRNTLNTRQLQLQPPSSVPTVPANVVISDQGCIISNQIQTNNENRMITTKL